MAKKVIFLNEVSEMISKFLDFLPVLEGYEWDFYFDFNLVDEQTPVVITLKLLKKNV